VSGRRRRDDGRHQPVERVEGGFELHLDDEELALVRRLLDELRGLVTGPADEPLLRRLFPAAYSDDPERDAEYQRLMRDELVASKLAGITAVETALGRGGVMSEPELLAFVQALNGIRLALGTMLDIRDDGDIAPVDPDDEDAAERFLYEWFSYLLDDAVRAMSS
jgi:hypothetical protein